MKYRIPGSSLIDSWLQLDNINIKLEILNDPMHVFGNHIIVDGRTTTRNNNGFHVSGHEKLQTSLNRPTNQIAVTQSLRP